MMLYRDGTKNTTHSVHAYTRKGNVYTLDIIDFSAPSGFRRVVCGEKSIIRK